MTVVEAMVAEIDGWDDDLRVILPQRSISGTGFWRPTSRSSSGAGLPGPPGTRPVSGYPETRIRTLGLTEMQIKDVDGIWGISAWVSAAHLLRLRACSLVTGRSHRPRPPGQTRPG